MELSYLKSAVWNAREQGGDDAVPEVTEKVGKATATS